MNLELDYYSILGVDKSIDQKELKKVYRKLSLTLHPDKGGDTETFNNIVEAYTILTSVRDKYDTLSRYGKNYSEQTVGFANFDISKLNKEVEKKSKDKDILVLEYPYTNQSNIHLKYTYKSLCNRCNGTGNDKDKKIDCFICIGEGSINGKTCLMCEGTGEYIQECAYCLGSGKDQFNNMDCTLCKGHGYLTSSNCEPCSGSGLKNVESSLNLDLTKLSSAEENEFIYYKVPLKGNFSLKRKKRMDLVLKFQI